MLALIAMMLDRLRRHQVATLLGLAATAVLIGAGLFALTQHVPFTTALYWAVTTATTVGYGDVTPHTGAGRAIAVGLMLVAIPLFGGIFALLAGVAAVVQVRRLFGMEHRIPSGDYRIVFGMHPAVPRILEELTADRRAVVLVADVDPASVPPEVRVVRGDPTNEAVIRKSHPDRAQQALVTGDDGDVLVTAVSLRSLAPDLPIAALAQSAKVAQALRDLGVSHTLSADELVGHTVAKSLETPHAADLMLRLVDSSSYVIQEIACDPPMLGRPLAEIRLLGEGLVLGLVRGGTVTLGIGEELTVGPEDRLLVLRARR